MSILALTSNTLVTAAAGQIEYDGQFFATDSAASRAQLQRIVRATAVTSTSGTSIDFTGIPAWVERITVMFSGVSSSGTSAQQVQLGDSGGFETSGYTGVVGTRGGETFYTAGFLVNRGNTASTTASGSLVLTLVSGNIWSGTGVNAGNATDAPSFFGGTKTLSDVLTQVRITTVNGTDTFDAGSVNIMYEG
jgi:hypothetical protein